MKRKTQQNNQVEGKAASPENDESFSLLPEGTELNIEEESESDEDDEDGYYVLKDEQERAEIIDKNVESYTPSKIKSYENNFRQSLDTEESVKNDELQNEARRLVVQVKEHPTKALKDEAITKIIIALKKYIYHLIFRNTQGKNHAEDMFQDCCEAVMLYFDRYQPVFKGNNIKLTTFYTPYFVERINTFSQIITNQKKSSHYQKFIKGVTDAEAEARARGLDPTDVVILSILSQTRPRLTIKEVEKGLKERMLRNIGSLDADEAEKYIDERYRNKNPEQIAVEAEKTRIISNLLDRLKVENYEKVIYKLFYGFEVPGVAMKCYSVSSISNIMNHSVYKDKRKFYPAVVNDIISRIDFLVRHDKAIMGLSSAGLTRQFFAAGGRKLVPNDDLHDVLDYYDFIDD